MCAIIAQEAWPEYIRSPQALGGNFVPTTTFSDWMKVAVVFCARRHLWVKLG